MKRLFILGLLVALLSCSKKSDPIPTQVYTSLVGKWKFTTTNGPTRGEFQISSYSGSLVIDDGFGSWTAGGKTYTIAQKYQIQFGAVPGTIALFWLLDNTKLNGFAFLTGETNSDFTKMTFTSFYYVFNNAGSPNYRETVTIVRE